MVIDKETLKNIEAGQFSDKELQEGLTFWSDLVDALQCLGPKWSLATSAATSELEYLRQIKSARRIRS